MVTIDPDHGQGAGHGRRHRGPDTPSSTSSPRAPASPAPASSSSPCWPRCSRAIRSTTPSTPSRPCAIDFPTDHDLVTHPASNDEGNGGGVVTLLNATAQSTQLRLHPPGPRGRAAQRHQHGPQPRHHATHLPEYPVDRDRLDRRASHRDGRRLRHRGRRRRVPRPLVHRPHRRPSRVDHLHRGDPGPPGVSPQIAAEATVALQAVVQYGTGTGGQPLQPAGGRQDRAPPTTTSTPGSTASRRRWRPRCGWATSTARSRWSTSAASDRSTAATFPAHTWHDFMTAALAGLPSVPFPPLDYGLLPAATTSRLRRWSRTTCSTTTTGTCLHPIRYTPARARLRRSLDHRARRRRPRRLRRSPPRQPATVPCHHRPPLRPSDGIRDRGQISTHCSACRTSTPPSTSSGTAGPTCPSGRSWRHRPGDRPAGAGGA